MKVAFVVHSFFHFLPSVSVFVHQVIFLTGSLVVKLATTGDSLV
jgi:hypothetical protein